MIGKTPFNLLLSLHSMTISRIIGPAQGDENLLKYMAQDVNCSPQYIDMDPYRDI